MSEPRSWSEVDEVKSIRGEGAVNVMSGAPFGYRYVAGQEGGVQARFEPVAEQARVVKQIFAWVAQDRCSFSGHRRENNSAAHVAAREDDSTPSCP